MKKSVTIFLVLLCTFSVFGQTWTLQKSGTSNQLRHVFFVDANTGWVVGDRTILKTTDGGTNWTPQGTMPLTSYLQIGCYFIDANTGWIGGEGGVYKTTDGGKTWNNQSGPFGITKVFFIDKNTGWAVGGHDGSTPVNGDIFKTTDGGTTWTHQTNTSTWSRFYGVQFVDANTGWAYTESNGLLIKTTDGGNTWVPQMQYGTTVQIRGMYFTDKDNGWVFGNTTSAPKIYKTTNGGAKWDDVTGSLSAGPTQAHFTSKNTGWALARGQAGRGVIKTTDNGATWTFTSLGATATLNHLFMLDENHGWAVSDNGAIYNFTGTGATDVEKNNTKVSGYALDQNYPNPFNPSTTINYSIAKAGLVNLTVYNILGNEVATLVNEEQASGSHSVKFDASSLSNGVYLYKITSGNFSSTKKLVLMK
ncbi:MAG: YCF48-related protein [Acidobacteriota bacterium]